MKNIHCIFAFVFLSLAALISADQGTNLPPIPAPILERFDKAQEKAGIPKEKRVPIQWMSPEDENWGKWMPNEGGKIAINSDFENLPEEIQSITIHHEVCHEKHLDGPIPNSVIGISLAGPFLGAPISHSLLTAPAPGIISTTIAFAPMMLPLAPFIYQHLYRYHIEHRADKAGAYASQCWCCVAKYADHRPSRSAYLLRLKTSAKYYPCKEEFHAIAGQLLHENEQNICSYHLEKMEQDSEFKQEMLEAKPIITAAFEEYRKQQEKTFYNRSKKLATKGVAALSAGKNMIAQTCTSTVKRMAQPRGPLAMLKFHEKLEI